MRNNHSKTDHKHNGAGKHSGNGSTLWLPGKGNNGKAGPVLITGGAGFIGTNLAHRFLSRKQPVLLYDNLSRPGVEQNLAWLRKKHGELLQIEVADVRDERKLASAVKRASKVFHFAAQVAVTTSLVDPIEDFEINARGTLNLLEAIRGMDVPPPLVFTSTNKVYGDLQDVKLEVRGGRYEPSDPSLRHHGFSEQRPLNFHSPYGCSKGAACQYVLDYARTFHIPAVVFRMSCIYGWHQFGNEDQGWVAHFLLRALEKRPITIFGDGRQVRDILFAEDLVNAFLQAMERIDAIAGEAYNMGGGPDNTISLLELLDIMAELRGEKPEVVFDDWRPADQQYYVSDYRKFHAATGWKPQTSAKEGIRSVYEWLRENRMVDPSRIVRVGPLMAKRNGHPTGNGRCEKSSGTKRRIAKPMSSSNGAALKRPEHKLAKVG
ncbi:MAG TPA: NAD-dependent epimerase/dehydratase family protein [Candidatus Saccharimonadales bacterium]|nr:NAD-dependent epimerase/dehydratase family protein [Candidatus Saccharimonadales bacterium]